MKISDGEEHQVWLLDPSQYPPTYKIVMKKNVVYVKDFVAEFDFPSLCMLDTLLVFVSIYSSVYSKR